MFGVPQGSVLGPTLFLIYINDLVSAQGRAKTILFADDTTFFQSYHPSEVENVDLAETEINLQQWFLANRLSLNHSKSQKMNFSLRKTELHHPILVGCATEANFLGASLDPGLTWKGHIVSIFKVLSS